MPSNVESEINYKVINWIGQEILSSKSLFHSFEISLANFANGIYFIIFKVNLIVKF